MALQSLQLRFCLRQFRVTVKSGAISEALAQGVGLPRARELLGQSWKPKPGCDGAGSNAQRNQ